MRFVCVALQSPIAYQKELSKEMLVTCLLQLIHEHNTSDYISIIILIFFCYDPALECFLLRSPLHFGKVR